ncbi:uncharacterized protein LOC135710696 [Ochlerotatus camptorhynchus]|uniref:uncharacterized protein LOC135710696 n=1 Tax=Ochlerotatus camptorhynchus TaxID=644619 RepID=UPI0031D02404
MKIFIVALLCISSAFADVSEIIHHEHQEHQEARPFDILTINNINVEHQPSTLEHISEAIHVQEPAAVGFGLPDEGIEILEAIEVLPVVNADAVVTRVQLTEAHADYQGPYHYEKPTVQLKYGAPQPTPVEPSVPVEPPTLKDQSNNYLPPKYTGDNLVKRHAKYIVRRRV